MASTAASATSSAAASRSFDIDSRFDATSTPIDRRLNAPSGGVSWGAILAGAAAAAALSLALLMLGVGLGLSAVSPWRQDGITAATFGISTILWITFTQVVASGMGGYLAGRLRTRWHAVASDEIYFRDTAHGFLAWAIASLATAALLTSAIASIIGGSMQVVGTVADRTVTATAAAVGSAAVARTDPVTAGQDATVGNLVDALLRAPAESGDVVVSTVPPSAAPTAEVSRIILRSLQAGSLAEDDARYLGKVVARHTGETQAVAQQRVTDAFARAQTALREAEVKAREATDAARKASAYAALWLFISLLMGAFAASIAATYGGRQRDA